MGCVSSSPLLHAAPAHTRQLHVLWFAENRIQTSSIEVPSPNAHACTVLAPLRHRHTHVRAVRLDRNTEVGGGELGLEALLHMDASEHEQRFLNMGNEAGVSMVVEPEHSLQYIQRFLSWQKDALQRDDGKRYRFTIVLIKRADAKGDSVLQAYNQMRTVEEEELDIY